MKPKKIKLFWALGLTATLLASATVALSILWPRLFPSLYVSDLYRRYENNEYIRATEIHNFHDTLAVETLLLEASTDSAWCALLLDFGMPEEMIADYKCNKEFYVGGGRNSITLLYIDNNIPPKRVPRTNPDSRLVICSHDSKSLCIFLTDEKEHDQLIKFIKIKQLKNDHEIQNNGTFRSAEPGRYQLPERQ